MKSLHYSISSVAVPPTSFEKGVGATAMLWPVTDSFGNAIRSAGANQFHDISSSFQPEYGNKLFFRGPFFS